MNLQGESIIDRMQFGPPKGFTDVSASVNVEKKANGGITKTVVITSTMPSSYPNLDAEPTVIEANGLTITSKMQIVNNIVISQYIYDAQQESFMPTNIEAKIEAINNKQDEQLPKPEANSVINIKISRDEQRIIDAVKSMSKIVTKVKDFIKNIGIKFVNLNEIQGNEL